MKPDHEAARHWAPALANDVVNNPMNVGAANVAACYLDAMARLDKATELLREVSAVRRAGMSYKLNDRIRAFLDERK